MKTKYFMMVCIAMLTMGTIQAPAQGLGGLLKKGKKHWRRSTMHLVERPRTTNKTPRQKPCRQWR